MVVTVVRPLAIDNKNKREWNNNKRKKFDK